MKNKVNYSPADKVRGSKVCVLILAVLCFGLGIIMIVKEETLGFTLVGVGISCCIAGGILEGLTQITRSSCEQSWLFAEKMREEKLRQEAEEMDDADILEY